MIFLREKDKIYLEKTAKLTLKTSCSIIAYGNCVDSTAHETSDLDIVIKSKNKKSIDIDELIAFKNAVQDSTIPIFVDIFDWYRIPDYFKKNILRLNKEL